jgi:hypothetical protein
VVPQPVIELAVVLGVLVLVFGVFIWDSWRHT